MSKSIHSSELKKEIEAAFRAMWGLHPSPVMLIKADRDILAVNEAGRKLGIQVGQKCFALTGNKGICKGCQGNDALKNGSARRLAAWSEKLNMFTDTYWVPVVGEQGLFVHFGNNITEWVKDELCR